MYYFSNLEPVSCSMSRSNCCFLTCIQTSQEAIQVVCYGHLFQKFPQFIVIHTVKGFGIVNKAEIDVFLELSCFFQKKWSSHHGQKKSPKCSTWMQSQKRQNDLCLFPRQMSMPQPVTLKKLKLNGSMKTYKTF